MRDDIFDLKDFQSFCKDLENCLKDDFSQLYAVDPSDIFFRSPKNAQSIVQEGDVYTWKIGIVVSFGEKRQVIKIDLENRKPLTTTLQYFSPLPGSILSSRNLFVYSETPEELIVDKFISLFDSKRIQLKDFYDFSMLSRYTHSAVNNNFLFEKIRRKYHHDDFIVKIQNRINIFDDIHSLSKSLHNELARFIPKASIDSCLSQEMIAYTVQQIHIAQQTYFKKIGYLYNK